MRIIKALTLTSLVLIGAGSLKAQAADLTVEQVEACSKLQMSQSIDLMNAIDRNIINFIPNLMAVLSTRNL